MARPRVFTVGTARDLADHAAGYSASGESEFSRQIAHSANVKLAGYVEPKAPQWTRTAREALGEKIAKQTQFLAALHMKLRFEPDEERRAKIRKNIEIKTRYLAKLVADQSRG